ncbi:MAG TPA: acyltransferase [Candidatus Limnocylindria bacterium]|nr:acyltransferase [Candidatus Limnocylindria bacterium]
MTSSLDEELRRLRERLGTEMAERFERDLPFQDLLDDRWERARRLGFGQGASIYASAYVYGNVTVGDGTWIGPNVLLDGSGPLRIGAGCNISAGAQVYTHDTVKRVLSHGAAGIDHAPTSIGDWCHIGAGAIVAKGVTIGDHAVIGACAFVNRDVLPFSVVAGVPARAIGRVVVADDGGVSLVYDGAE